MADRSRSSPRADQAQQIEWRPWGPEAFDRAARAEKPILLSLTAVWCRWCRRMDETTYSDPRIIRLINDELVPVRVDADRYPHVQDRYIAGGWPTNAFLTPTGEVLWSGTYIPPDEFWAVANGVLSVWRERREALESEIERRRKALEAARSQRPALGLVRREAADDVLSATQDAFDPRNGGFGTEPKFPPGEAIELLFVQGFRMPNPDWVEMAEQTLDGMRAGELWDEIDGGFFRYAMAADWTAPRHEKLLPVNADLLRAYALGAHLSRRGDWGEIAERTVAWAERVLRRPDGLWGGSQDADEDYYRLDEDDRRRRLPPAVDPVLYTNWNAQWIQALAEAGGRLGREDWIARAAGALERLLETMAAPGDLLYHFQAPGERPDLPGLLTDSVAAANACVAVGQATGRREFIDHARRLVAGMQRAFWAEGGGFYDHVRSEHDVGALRYRDRPFDLNASAARLLLDLALATGERSYRAMAERTLALLSPLAGRYGVAGAVFALAVEEFFEPPLQIVVVGPPEDAAPLRMAALRLGEPDRKVWSLEAGGRLGALEFPAQAGVAAYVCGPRACSPPIRDPAALQPAVDALR